MLESNWSYAVSNKSQITGIADGGSRAVQSGRNICVQRFDRYYGVCVMTGITYLIFLSSSQELTTKIYNCFREASL